jgi:lipid IVA palmitoyltransferase
MKPALSVALLALLLGPTAYAADTGIAPSFKSAASSELSKIWDEGATDVYLPLHTHHLRQAYSPELIASFNENPGGFGMGRSYKDADGGWHAMYAMAFKDSHYKVEPVVGYGRLYPVARAGDAGLNLGYTAFITARNDIAHYAPIPGVFPMASVETGRLSLMTTFMPGRRNSGNIFFIFGKYTLSK